MSCSLVDQFDQKINTVCVCVCGGGGGGGVACVCVCVCVCESVGLISGVRIYTSFLFLFL